MKALLRYLWFRVTTKHGDLVAADTVRIVIGDTVLEESKNIIGTYTTMSVNSNYCNVKTQDGYTLMVPTKSVKKISTTKNPELFI